MARNKFCRVLPLELPLALEDGERLLDRVEIWRVLSDRGFDAVIRMATDRARRSMIKVQN